MSSSSTTALPDVGIELREGYAAVGEVRQGKVIDLDLSESDAGKARAAVKEMCEKLLANTVIEKYEIELKS